MIDTSFWPSMLDCGRIRLPGFPAARIPHTPASNAKQQSCYFPAVDEGVATLEHILLPSARLRAPHIPAPAVSFTRARRKGQYDAETI